MDLTFSFRTTGKRNYDIIDNRSFFQLDINARDVLLIAALFVVDNGFALLCYQQNVDGKLLSLHNNAENFKQTHNIR
jgi:hypothetical protein